MEPTVVPVSDYPPANDIPHERIAERAFEKWLARGAPRGDDGQQDWFAARQELELEAALGVQAAR